MTTMQTSNTPAVKQTAAPTKAPTSKTPAVKKTAAPKAAPAKKTAVAKKVAAKKVAAKAPVKPKADYKAGARVKTLAVGNGKEYKGYVTKVYSTPTGPFISVNIGDKKNPVIKDFRPARVKGF